MDIPTERHSCSLGREKEASLDAAFWRAVRVTLALVDAARFHQVLVHVRPGVKPKSNRELPNLGNLLHSSAP